MDIALLEGSASERVLSAVTKINDDAPDKVRIGLEEIVTLTKRTDDVSEVLDKLIEAQLLPTILSFLKPELISAYEGEVAVRGLAVVPVTVPQGEAVQLAACTSLGELIWHRDTSSDVRPVLLLVGGMAALANLLRQTPSERVRLKVLVLTRRMLYEVGSTAVMDSDALQAAEECQLMAVLVDLLTRAVDQSDAAVTMDTLEGVTYLLQRMQACMSEEQKELCGLATQLRIAATKLTSLLKTNIGHDALAMAMLGVRELCWNDHNEPLEPAMTQFAEVGAFEAIAALLAPHANVSPRPSYTGEPAPPPMPILAAVEAGTVSQQLVGMACQLLERIAAAKQGTLPELLESQVSQLFHRVIFHLVDALDGAMSREKTAAQGAALYALRKLLVTEHSQAVSKPAAEAAEAEGVPARLLALAQTGIPFGGSGEACGGADDETARDAAALLAELSASTAMLAARHGRPAQAADVLAVVEPLVPPLIGQLENSTNACRTYCRALYALSVIQWDDPFRHVETEDITAEYVPPPEEQQYALSSQLVTHVGKVAQGITALLSGGFVSRPRAASSVLDAPPSPNTIRRRVNTAESNRRPSMSDRTTLDSDSMTAERLGLLLAQLQRATVLMHELTGLKPQSNALVSKHNVDALFVHGAFQALLQQAQRWYQNKKAALKAAARAEAESAALLASADVQEEESEILSARPSAASITSAAGSNIDLMSTLDMQSSLPPLRVTMSRASSMSGNQNPLLHPLLHQEMGVLELTKELVRDCADARLKLRDIGALSQFAHMLSDNPRDNLLVSLQFNLARSEALHAAIRQEGCLGLMEKVLAQAPQMDGAQHEVRRLLALCVLGLAASDVPGSKTGREAKDPASRRAAALLEKHDMPGLMERILRDACRDGCYVINSSTSAWPFTLESAAYTVQCLARCDATARKLCERHVPEMLLSALCNKHGSAAEPALRIVRALLNFARLPDLRAELLSLGAADTLNAYTLHEDARTSDAARGCLLQLGELQDLPAKVALQATLPQSLEPILSQPLTLNDQGVTSEPAAYDVLLCYKRGDAHHLARALHTALVLRGIGCLLDYEYAKDLSGVDRVVARARNLLVILTDNFLTSRRCLAELAAAAAHNVNVIIVIKEGARWGDSNGTLLSMPPQHTIKALQRELQGFFACKPVHHRDEHYAYFIAQLLKRIKTTTVPPNGMSNAPSRLRVSMSGGSAAVPPRSVQQLQTAASRRFYQGTEGGMRHTSPQLNLPGLDVLQPSMLSPRQVAVVGGISQADFQALAAMVAAQSAQVAQMAAEMSAIREMGMGITVIKSALQDLSSDISLIKQQQHSNNSHRRSPPSSAKNVKEPHQAGPATDPQQLTALRSELDNVIRTEISSLKCEIAGSLALHNSTLSSVAGDLRRGVADCVSAVTALQGQVRGLSLNVTQQLAATNNTSPAQVPVSPVNHTNRHHVLAVGTDGGVYHSSPVGGQAEGSRPDKRSASHSWSSIEDNVSNSSLHPLTSSSSTTLPLIHTHGSANSQANQPTLMTGALVTSRSNVRTSPGKLNIGSIPMPYAPNVGGFQGARIAAVQNKIGNQRPSHGRMT